MTNLFVLALLTASCQGASAVSEAGSWTVSADSASVVLRNGEDIEQTPLATDRPGHAITALAARGRTVWVGFDDGVVITFLDEGTTLRSFDLTC